MLANLKHFKTTKIEHEAYEIQDKFSAYLRWTKTVIKNVMMDWENTEKVSGWFLEETKH